MEHDDVIDVADLAAVLTTAGVTIYVLGLTGIYLSMRLRLPHNTSTAWYVASLLPRTVVAGQGVRIWLGMPLFVTVVGGLTILVLAEGPNVWIYYTFSIFSVIGFAVMSFAVVHTVYALKREELVSQTSEWAAILISISTPWLGIFLIQAGGAVFAKGLFGVAYGWPFTVIDPNQNVFLVGGVLLFVGGYFVGVPLAATINLPFPRVRIATKDEGVTLEEVTLEGQLVAHRDGFWHLFGDKDNEFLSIPDERVITVRIHENGAKPTVDKEALAMSLITPAFFVVSGTIWAAIGGNWGYAIGIAAGLLIAAYIYKRVRKQPQHRQNKRGNEE